MIVISKIISNRRINCEKIKGTAMRFSFTETELNFFWFLSLAMKMSKKYGSLHARFLYLARINYADHRLEKGNLRYEEGIIENVFR